MYAIVRDGNKSFRCEEGAVLRLDLRTGAGKGDTITLDRVEFVGGDSPRVGTPTVKGARVLAEVRGEVRGDKLIAFKYKNRKGFEKKRGHRQRYTEVRVTKVEA
ncbi:MAG: 50S ribosomal protein L21 [Planctomycetes bacterium]|nr:50S ribosomal protein L21 [Planctomycetota bacterium]